MTVQLDKNILFSTFGVSSFEQLDSSAQTMAPSMIEYYLSDISSNLENQSTYINKSNIQQTIYLDEYSIYLDYNDEIYMEFEQSSQELETQSLW